VWVWKFGWAAFGKLRRGFSSSIPQSLKTKVFNQCVLEDIRSRDVDTHGTAGLQVQGRSASCGKSYARGFSVGSNPKLSDLAENLSHRHNRISMLKWQWAGLISRITDNRWVNEFWSGDRVLVNGVEYALRPGGVTIYAGRLEEAGCE
jgi:hypothetical protein